MTTTEINNQEPAQLNSLAQFETRELNKTRERPWNPTSFPDLLIRLAEILTQKDHDTEWLNLGKVTALCRSHQPKIQTHIRIGAREFKELCRRHFGDEGHGEITWENIRISQRTVGNRSGCNKTIQLRFQRLHPAIT